jgi:geranylgeranyl pyrophosphate synthase
MSSELELMESVKGIIEKRGTAAIEQARKELLDTRYDSGSVSSALKYFAQVTLQGGLPVFPALISLSCEAVGGKTAKTTSIGAALTLIAGAADIHDDIIDQSTVKYSKKTVLGKFGSDTALLAGDALLIQGVMLLHKECDSLPEEQRETILSLLFQAFMKISKAEAAETRLMKKLDVQPEKYFEIIKMKAVVPELHCKIGAILGNGDASAVEALGHYGLTFGITSTVRDEFIDLLEYQELRNRLENECPPLPFLWALQNSRIKTEVMALLKNAWLSRNNFREITRIILKSQEVQRLKRDICSLAKKDLSRLKLLKDEQIRRVLQILLLASLAYLEENGNQFTV